MLVSKSIVVAHCAMVEREKPSERKWPHIRLMLGLELVDLLHVALVLLQVLGHLGHKHLLLRHRGLVLALARVVEVLHSDGEEERGAFRRVLCTRLMLIMRTIANILSSSSVLDYRAKSTSGWNMMVLQTRKTC